MCFTCEGDTSPPFFLPYHQIILLIFSGISHTDFAFHRKDYHGAGFMENKRINQIRQYVQDIPVMLERKRMLEGDLFRKEGTHNLDRHDSTVANPSDWNSKAVTS